MSRSRLQRAAIVVLALAAGLLVLLGLLSTTLVQGRLIGWAFGTLERQLAIVGHADSLDLDLAALDVRLHGLTLAARDHEDRPFFTVDEARIDLPWSALWRAWSVDALELVRPRFEILQRADGTSNLPASEDRPPTSSTPASRQLLIGSLTARDLTVDWRNEATDAGVALGSTSLVLNLTDAGSIRGPLRLDGEIAVTVGGQAFRVSAAEGELTFDGSSVGIERLVVEADEGTVNVSGVLADVLTEPRLAAAFEADLDLEPLLARIAQPETTAGRLAVSGQLDGTAVDVTLTGHDLQWNDVVVDDLASRLRVVAPDLLIDDATLRVAGAELTANGRLALSDNGESSLRLAWRDVDADAWLDLIGPPSPLVLGTSLTGSLAAAWTALEPRGVTLVAESRGDADGRTGETRVEARGGTWRLTIDQPVAHAGRVTGTIDGRARSETWREMALGGTLRVSCDELARCREAFPAFAERAADLGGHATAVLELAGAVEDPLVTGTLAANDVDIAGLRALDLTAQLAVDLTALEVDALDTRLGGNRVGGRAHLAWETGVLTAALRGELDALDAFSAFVPGGWMPQGRVVVDASLGGRLTGPYVDALSATGTLQLAPLFAGTPEEMPLTGVVDVELAAQGPLANLQGRLSFAATELAWSEYTVGAADGSITLETDTLRAHAELPGLATAVDASMGLTEDRTLDVRAAVMNADLARIGTRTGLPLVGTTSLEVSFVRALATPGATMAELALGRLDGQIGETPLVLQRPATARYRDGDLEVEPLAVMVGGASVTLDGGLTREGTQTLTARLSGSGQDLARLLALVPTGETWGSRLDVAGDVAMEVRATGTLEAPVVTGTLRFDEGRVGVEGHPPLSDLSLRAAFRDGMLTLERLSATWQGASFNGRGTLAAGLIGERLPDVVSTRLGSTSSAAVLEVDIGSITPAVLAGYLDDATLAQLDGTVSARLTVQSDAARRDAVRASLTLPDATVTVSGIQLRQRRPTLLEVADGRLRVATFDWGNDTDYLTLGGSLSLGDVPSVDLTATGELDLRAVGAFAPGVATEGHALLIANATGPVDDLDVTGTIELTDSELRLADPEIVVSGLGGALWLERDRIRAHELSGSANGGTLRLAGALGLDSAAGVDLIGRGIAMELPDGLRTELDTDLRFAFEGGAPSLTGAVTVRRGDYREPLNLTSGLLAALQQRQQVAVVGDDIGTRLDELSLDVHVVTLNDVVVDNNYATGSVGLDLRVAGTVGSPAVTGRASLREGGLVRLGTAVYEIEAGTIDFVDPTGIQPELNVSARTRRSSYDLTLTVSGVPDALSTTLQSDPSLPESDIVSLLLTGRTLDQVGVAPGAAARDQALGLFSGELLGAAGRTVGLDTVRIEQDVDPGAFREDSTLIASETNPAARLTVGRNLSDEVQLVVSQNLRETGLLTWIVSYLPVRDIELRGVVDDENDRSYEFRHALSLGVPRRPVTGPTAAERQRVPEIAVIRFTGEPGFDVDELDELLDLNVREDFDFYRWQRDRSRLETLYRERGYLEAQVRARRLDDAADSVTLEYDIRQGPRAVLTIEGHELSSRTVDQMREAWADAVFDGFLREELRTLAQRALVGDGYVRPAIETEIIERPEVGEKEIVVRVEPGRRYAERPLAFEGNAAVSDDELRLQLEVRRVGEELAWADPGLVTEALMNVYRGRGFLEATVAAGDPELTADAAVLPFRVREGRAFEISEVTLDGVEALDPADVRATAGLRVGDVYTDRRVQQARANVGLRYRQTGFTTARVVIRSTVDRAADTVSVMIAVEEGRRQVIEAIEIDGATRTHAGLIARALDLDVGQPVDVDAWNEARKRLYDIGVFRSVDIETEPVRTPSPSDEAGGPQPVRARVLLEEWPAYRLRYGLQVKDELAPVGEQRELRLGLVGDLTHQNLLGRAATVGTAFRFDTIQQTLRGFLTVPRFFGQPVTSNVFVSRGREKIGEDQDAFINDITRLTLEQRLEPHPDLTLAYSYNFERNHTFLKDPDPFFPDEPPFRIVRLDASAIIDTRDDLFDATRGWFHSSTVEHAPSALGSDLRFAKYLAQQYHYHQRGGVVLATAARLGLATGFGDDLIPTERFHAGGGNTVRGYPQDSLGPVGFFGEPRGGNALLVLNQEVRFPLLWILRGVGFVDAGNVFASPGDVSLRDLEIGLGGGLRADTPFGLLRVDFGFPVSDDGAERTGRFFFSIGQAF